jgi:hypothetical protein
MNTQLFKFLKPSKSEFVPSVITTLQSITRFDMIYIYHHLNLETKVELRKTNVEGNYTVHFKSYKLGFVQFKKMDFRFGREHTKWHYKVYRTY